MEQMSQSEELDDKGMLGSFPDSSSSQAARASQADLTRGCVCARVRGGHKKFSPWLAAGHPPQPLACSSHWPAL